MEDAVVLDGASSQWMKVWLDDYQYRVIDTSSTSTVREMRKAMASKTGVTESPFDMLLEINLSNGDKSTRKMDEDEFIQQALDKHRNYAIRLLWLAPPAERPKSPDAKEAKYRCSPSKWSQMFKSVDSSIKIMKENYQNLPAHWLSLFKSLDMILISADQQVLSQSEMKFLISKCAAILLSLPGVQPEPMSPNYTRKGRPKSMELFSSSGGDRTSFEYAFKPFEQEISALQNNIQSRTLLTPTEPIEKLQSEIETDDEDRVSPPPDKHGDSEAFKKHIQQKFNLSIKLDNSSASSPSSSPIGFAPFTPRTPHTPTLYATPRTPLGLPAQSHSPNLSPYSLSHSPLNPSLHRVPGFMKPRANSTSTPSTPGTRKANDRPIGQDNDAVLKVLLQALQDRRQFIEEDEESYEEEN